MFHSVAVLAACLPHRTTDSPESHFPDAIQYSVRTISRYSVLSAGSSMFEVRPVVPIIPGCLILITTRDATHPTSTICACTARAQWCSPAQNWSRFAQRKERLKAHMCAPQSGSSRLPSSCSRYSPQSSTPSEHCSQSTVRGSYSSVCSGDSRVCLASQSGDADGARLMPPC
jgi:hypothetical protein